MNVCAVSVYVSSQALLTVTARPADLKPAHASADGSADSLLSSQIVLLCNVFCRRRLLSEPAALIAFH